MQDKLKYRRILLKISGEALAGDRHEGIIDYGLLGEICGSISKCRDMGAEIAIVVGAGNIWRGRMGAEMDRTRADHMGMLATVINALALQDAFLGINVPCRVMTAYAMHEVAEPYIRDRAVRHLEKGKIVVFGCGTGCPFFSTDTAAMLRAAEIKADAVLMAKNIDGVYTADPKKDPSAVKLDSLTYSDILANDLKVIDSTAASFGRDNRMLLHVFGISDPENLVRALCGEKIGTIIY